MNNIFLCLYLADLMQVAEVVSIMAVVALISALIFYFIVAGEYDSYRHGGHSEEDKDRLLSFMRSSKKVAWASFLVALLSAPMPSSKTIYMSMGLNVSNELVKSETGQKALKALNLKLDEIIEDSKK